MSKQAELSEPFLINPRRRKRHSRGRKHRPVAYSGKGGHWFTSSRAKKVRKGLRLNPFAGGLMAVNRHRRHHRGRRHRRNPELLGSISSLGGFNWMQGIEPAAVIGVSILAANLVPAFVQAKGYMAVDSTWKKYGIQIGTGMAGAYGLKMAGKHEWARNWAIGSLVNVVADLLQTYVWPSVVSSVMPVAAAPVVTTTPAVHGFRGMGAYPREVSGFGRVGMGAFPGSVSRQVSPYDRATIYPY